MLLAGSLLNISCVRKADQDYSKSASELLSDTEAGAQSLYCSMAGTTAMTFVRCEGVTAIHVGNSQATLGLIGIHSVES